MVYPTNYVWENAHLAFMLIKGTLRTVKDRSVGPTLYISDGCDSAISSANDFASGLI